MSGSQNAGQGAGWGAGAGETLAADLRRKFPTYNDLQRRAKWRICGSQDRWSPANSCTKITGVPDPLSS